MVKITPLITGFVFGIWIAVAQGVFMVYPPPVYGLCMVCHPRDLVNWILNHAFVTDFYIEPASVAFPVLITVFIVIGGTITAMRHKEFKVRPAHDPTTAFIRGFLVITFGLMLGACPIRAIAYASYGYPVMMLALASIILGILLASKYMLWKGRTQA